jgi:OHCU decarboxylase
VTSALERLNAVPADEAEARLLSCCGSREWARRLAAARPFRDAGELSANADRIWRSLGAADWLEAFRAHPRIGEKTGTDLFFDPKMAVDEPSGRKIDLSRIFSAREQEGTRGASPETLANLADANRDYEERFGHIFIVCATGKSAPEMLALLEARLHNDPETELATAAEEQRKILQLRLAKLLETEGA